MLPISINSDQASPKIAKALALLRDGRSLFQRIAAAFEAQTEANFEAEGRPHWAPLSKRTIAERLKRNNGGSVLKILQDRGILAASVSSDYGPDFALIGAGGAARGYAAIQQFGGTIERAPYSTKVRLRTDAKGNLVRQGTEGRSKNLAVFAKDRHKRARESWATVDAYSITIPARPYLPFTGTVAGASLQPEAAQSVLDVVSSLLGDTLA